MSESAIAVPTFSGDELDAAARADQGVRQRRAEADRARDRPALGDRGARLDPLEAQIRQVFFFDTPELALDRQGVVVRARRIQGKGDDSAVKLRPVVPAELPRDLRRSASFRVEVDALPGGYVCSAALKGRSARPTCRSAVAGELPLRKLFSKEQRAFFAAHVQEGIGLDDLAILGPIFVLKLPVHARRPRAPARRGDVALPGRLAHPRALDPLRHHRGVPGRGRAPQLPHRPWTRPLG